MVICGETPLEAACRALTKVGDNVDLGLIFCISEKGFSEDDEYADDVFVGTKVVIEKAKLTDKFDMTAFDNIDKVFEKMIEEIEDEENNE